MSAHPAAASAPTLPDAPAVRSAAAVSLWRITLVACAALTVGLVVWLGQQDPAARASRAADPDLLALMRLMAAIKWGAAIVLLWLTQWRLCKVTPPVRAVGLVGAAMLMVSGPALIWTMAGIGLGALAFYAGLVSLGALLWRDRTAILDMVAAQAVARRRRRDNPSG